MKALYLTVLMLMISISTKAIPADSSSQNSINHSIGIEGFGKQLLYSIFYEVDKTLNNKKHHLGLGYGLSSRRFKSPVARYFSNCIHTYYSYGAVNQIKVSLALDLATNITNYEGYGDNGEKRSAFIYTPSFSLGYLRTTKKNRLSYGANILGMLTYYDFFKPQGLIEKRQEQFISFAIYIKYNIFNK